MCAVGEPVCLNELETLWSVDADDSREAGVGDEPVEIERERAHRRQAREM